MASNMCCGINACSTHKACADLTLPCKIHLQDGILVIKPTNMSFVTDTQSRYLYEVTYPFTREELACLNVVDSPTPDSYVAAIKVHKRRQWDKYSESIRSRVDPSYAPIGPLVYLPGLQDTYQTIRNDLTTHKAMVLEYRKVIEHKNREIAALMAEIVKLKS